MPIINLGTRRLYDALGVHTGTTGEIHQKVEFAIGKTVTIYLGPNPPHGILSLEGCQYAIPGQNSRILHADIEYNAFCFLEVSISTPHEISTGQMDLLKQKDSKTQEELISEIREDSETTEHLLDAISGVLALRVHRQLVLKPLVENPFLSGEFEPVRSYVGPAMEMLEGINTNLNTSPIIQSFLDGMANTPKDILQKGGATLHWLLKAWRERDAISKFMYLFIPLESVLQSADDSLPNSKAELNAIESIVKACDDINKDSLLQFLKRARTMFGPTLNARFEEFARQASIPGWELDVKAFKKYNRMRNLLLHAGNKNVRGHINFEQNTRTLEDLVERYVALALLGSREVYKSRWRPARENDA